MKIDLQELFVLVQSLSEDLRSYVVKFSFGMTLINIWGSNARIRVWKVLLAMGDNFTTKSGLFCSFRVLEFVLDFLGIA